MIHPVLFMSYGAQRLEVSHRQTYIVTPQNGIFKHIWICSGSDSDMNPDNVEEVENIKSGKK
jgi:hypothetical protein